MDTESNIQYTTLGGLSIIILITIAISKVFKPNKLEKLKLISSMLLVISTVIGCFLLIAINATNNTTTNTPIFISVIWVIGCYIFGLGFTLFILDHIFQHIESDNDKQKKIIYVISIIFVVIIWLIPVLITSIYSYN